jgi:hypothetical protein
LPDALFVEIDEPQLAKLSNGTLVMVGHGDAKGVGRNTLAMASSNDRGDTWHHLHKIEGLVQPGCGLGMVIHADMIYLSHDNNGTIADKAHPGAHVRCAFFRQKCALENAHYWFPCLLA